MEAKSLIGSRDGFVCIDEADGRFRSFKSPRLRASIIVSSCYFNGKYYIGTYGGGMYVLDASTLELHDFDVASEPFLHGHIFVIRPDNRGNLWIGTSAGLYCFRDGKIVRHYTSDSSKGSFLKEMCMRSILIHRIRGGFVRRLVSVSGNPLPKV